MMTDSERARLIAVTAALTVVLGLAILLVARIVSPDAAATPPPAALPNPLEVVTTDLQIPCWACVEASSWPLHFRTDLDLLAPLGSGQENAGEFFVQFEKNRGPRSREAKDFHTRRSLVEGGGRIVSRFVETPFAVDVFNLMELGVRGGGEQAVVGGLQRRVPGLDQREGCLVHLEAALADVPVRDGVEMSLAVHRIHAARQVERFQRSLP